MADFLLYHGFESQQLLLNNCGGGSSAVAYLINFLDRFGRLRRLCVKSMGMGFRVGLCSWVMDGALMGGLRNLLFYVTTAASPYILRVCLDTVENWKLKIL